MQNDNLNRVYPLEMDTHHSAEDKGRKLLNDFITMYQSMNKDTLVMLEQIYHQDVVFHDPLHTVYGRDELRKYFAAMYENLLHIEFDIHNSMVMPGQIALEWTMNFSHKKLNKGQNIQTQGVSWLEYGKLITCHRDYFDAGHMLYEQMPILGAAIGLVKKKLVC